MRLEFSDETYSPVFGWKKDLRDFPFPEGFKFGNIDILKIVATDHGYGSVMGLTFYD